MLRIFTVDNFKSLINVTFEPAGLNLLVGSNNAGKRLGVDPSELRVTDPKPLFERAMGISRADKKESSISDFVASAPLGRWLHNASFNDLYEQVRDQSKRMGCPLENLRESS